MARERRSAREPSPWLVALRPARWNEAVLVLAPLVFAGLLADPPSMRLALQATAAFALLAAGADAVRAAAELRSAAIAALGCACVAGGLLLAWTVQSQAPPLSNLGPAALGCFGWGVIFLGLAAADALLLRRWPATEAAAGAVGYVLRVAGGAAALQLLPSRWLVVCSFALGLFVALGRVAWRTPAAGRDAPARRAVARRPGVMPAADVAAAFTAGCYVLYSLSPETQASIGSRDLLWTAPLVALTLARHREHIRLGFGRDPLELLLRDRLALGAIMLWITGVLFVVYRPW